MADYKSDIDKYLRGELTPAQMHALEKKALDDPFLADALEGLQSLSSDDVSTDMRQLQDDLTKRVSEKNRRWAWVGRIAAGLLLVAMSTYIIVSNLSNEQPTSDDLALSKQEEKLAPPPEAERFGVADSATSAAKDKDISLERSHHELEEAKKQKPATDQESKVSPREQRAPAAAPLNSSKGDISDVQTEEEVLTDERDAIAGNAQPQAKIAEGPDLDSVLNGRVAGVETSDDKSKRAFEVRKAESTAPSATQPSFSYSPTRKVVRGKVTFAEDGTGLPGVNVLIRGSNEGTVTDAQGNYQIAVDGTQPVLTFSFIGFTSKELPVDAEQLDVQLDADVSELNEVVVMGYGSGVDRDFSPGTPPVTELAAPAGGRKAFKQYLESNLRYPEQALKNNIEGKVTVQFTIGMTGQISDFRVIRGIGYGCDEEVIRLIKAGPKWSPTKKNEEPIKDRVRVRMRFALPKK